MPNPAKPHAMHWATLSFLDREEERRYALHFARSNRGYLVTGYLFLVAFIVLFGLVEQALFEGELLTLLWGIRYGAMLPYLILVGPVMLVKLVTKRFEHIIQEVMLAILLPQIVGLAIMGVLLFDNQGNVNTLYHGTMAYMLVMAMLYLASRLRFTYAASVGLIGLAFAFGAGLWADLNVGETAAASMFAIAINAIGLFGSYQMERSVRQNFIQLRIIEDERARSESLLLNIFPAQIAQRLKSEEAEEIADSFASVSVLFADIVGFTALSERLPPGELVQLLNRLFTAFDALTVKYGVEKIKTIGDAYMAAAGLPTPREDHAVVLADMALEMHEVLRRESATVGEPLKIRIGLHTGEVVAGVIGQRRFCYDLWGDTVNTAARMESHSLPDHIQLTPEIGAVLEPSFHVEERGVVEVKGKGPMTTYWLKGRKGDG